MTIETLHTDAAPAAIGPYAQAVKANGFLFTAGQIPLHPQTLEVTGATVAEQTVQVMENLRAVLETAGVGFGDVIKTTVFLRDMADFAAMNEVYANAFGDARPARSTVAVAGLPRDVRVEIELVALLR